MPSSADTALGALATVARHHGLDVGAAEVGTLARVPPGPLDLSGLLVAAHQLGFRAIPLEGTYEDLPELTLPGLAVVSEGSDPQYVVLRGVASEAVQVEDPATGAILPLSREAFCAAWTGDLVQLEPVPDRVPMVRTELQALRDPWRRVARGLGLVPPWSRVGWVAAAAGAAALLWGATGDLPAGALGLALVAATWAWQMRGTCAACDRADAAVGGLPVAGAGAGAYLALLGAAALGWTTVTGLGLAAALGVHSVLLGLLAWRRLRCPVCLIAGAAIGVGAGSLDGWTALHAGALVAAAALTLAGIALARRLRALALASGSARIAAETLAIQPRPPVGAVRLWVMTREGCGRCAALASVILPGLQETYGDALSVAPIPPSRHPTGLPLVVVQGTLDAWMVDPPDYQALAAVVEAALNPALAPVAGLGLVAVAARPQ